MKVQAWRYRVTNLNTSARHASGWKRRLAWSVVGMLNAVMIYGALFWLSGCDAGSRCLDTKAITTLRDQSPCGVCTETNAFYACNVAVWPARRIGEGCMCFIEDAPKEQRGADEIPNLDDAELPLASGSTTLLGCFNAHTWQRVPCPTDGTYCDNDDPTKPCVTPAEESKP